MRCIKQFLAVVALVVAVPAVSLAAPLLYYTVEEVRAGDVVTPMLVPGLLRAPLSAPSERVRAVVTHLKTVAPKLFDGVDVELGGDFDVTRVVVVKVNAEVEEGRWQRAASVLVASLRPHGVRQIRVSGTRSGELGPADIALPVLGLVVPAWEALPPRHYEGAIVAVGDGTFMDSASFYEALNRRDAKLSHAIAAFLHSHNTAAKVRICESIASLALPDPAAAVLPLLDDSNVDVKIAAIEALDHFRSNPRVIAALERVVDKDPSPDVKTAAVRVLVAAGKTKYEVFTYIAKLRDPNDAVVFKAVERLVASGNPAVAPALVEVLDHRAPEVRDAALHGLIALKNGAALRLALTKEGVPEDARIEIAKALTGLDDRGDIVAGLGYLVRHAKPAIAARAAEALGKLGAREGIPALTDAVARPEEKVAVAAAKALGALGATGALDALARASVDRRPAVARAATEAAVRMLSAQSQSSVIAASRSKDAVVRRLALMALASFADNGRNRAVVGVLRERLQDSDPAIRRAAVYALAHIQDRDLARKLAALKNDPDAQIRAQVAFAQRWRTDADAVDVLMELLGDAEADVKLQAAESLGKLGDHRALDRLLQFVDYGRADVRKAVLEAVVACAKPADRDRLLDIYLQKLYDSDPGVKLVAIRAVEGIHDPRVISGLSGLVIDPDHDVKKAALLALGKQRDPSATEAIARALFEPNPRDIKEAAIEALRISGQHNARKPLQEFVVNSDDDTLRKKAESALDAL